MEINCVVSGLRNGPANLPVGKQFAMRVSKRKLQGGGGHTTEKSDVGGQNRRILKKSDVGGSKSQNVEKSDVGGSKPQNVEKKLLQGVCRGCQMEKKNVVGGMQGGQTFRGPWVPHKQKWNSPQAKSVKNGQKYI